MSYFLADAKGYVDDFGSIGGLKQFAVWAAGIGGAVAHFARTGSYEDPKVLATQLKDQRAQGGVEELRQMLVDAANKADAVLILTDGAGGEDALRVNADRVGIAAFAFDKSSEHARAWAEEHAGELIQGISRTTRDSIRELIESSLDDEQSGPTVDELASRIDDLLGDSDRADMIARTESIRAANAGQQEAWDQAVEQGLLTGDEKQVWIATPDEITCPVCDDLDGTEVRLGQEFDDGIDGPPAHPNCRCAVGLVGE